MTDKEKFDQVMRGVISISKEEMQKRLDVDKKTLESAPGFDKDNWPDMGDIAWRAEVFSYYGATPYWEETKTLHGGSGL